MPSVVQFLIGQRVEAFCPVNLFGTLHDVWGLAKSLHGVTLHEGSVLARQGGSTQRAQLNFGVR